MAKCSQMNDHQNDGANEYIMNSFGNIDSIRFSLRYWRFSLFAHYFILSRQEIFYLISECDRRFIKNKAYHLI